MSMLDELVNSEVITKEGSLAVEEGTVTDTVRDALKRVADFLNKNDDNEPKLYVNPVKKFVFIKHKEPYQVIYLKERYASLHVLGTIVNLENNVTITDQLAISLDSFRRCHPVEKEDEQILSNAVNFIGHHTAEINSIRMQIILANSGLGTVSKKDIEARISHTRNIDEDQYSVLFAKYGLPTYMVRTFRDREVLLQLLGDSND
uniref:Uncharacterized protein n=2 Tax=Enterococcus phage Porthos TaxID=2795670 RepID=A0A8D6XV36_9CAUD